MTLITSAKLKELREEETMAELKGLRSSKSYSVPEYRQLLDTLEKALAVVEAAKNGLAVLQELNQLNWEPKGRPFNWDEIEENLDEALAPFQEER